LPPSAAAAKLARVMAPTAQVLPYGAWPSPFSAAMVAEAGFLFGQLTEPTLTPAGLFWLEARSEEDGRTALMRQVGEAAPVEVGPPGLDAHTRVHEYGGGAYAVHGEHVWISSGQDGRILRVELASGTCEPITAAPAKGVQVRFADLQVTPDGARLLAVRETHADGEVRNELVALPADGSSEPAVLASGHDFYAAPRCSPDGRRLAFLCWDHPQMPWDGTELMLASLTPGGGLTGARMLAGSHGESIVHPAWSPGGELHIVADRSGWWSIYRLTEAGRCELVVGGERELGMPAWRLGLAPYAFLADGTLCCVAREDGVPRLGIARDGRFDDLGLPYREFMATRLTALGSELAFVAATPERPPAVIRLDVATRSATTVRTSRVPVLAPDAISTPRRIAYDSDGLRCFMNYYPPANASVAAPTGELPPLIVNVHGGPTAAAPTCLDLGVQFWTSRGFAYADVDYGGSTGLGRAYRERLKGNWGVTDVRDAVNAAAHLVAEGLVDAARHAIRGMSAGGYTTLCALANTDAFAAGASYFGIADMELMARNTHKFESHYVDVLLGRVPDMRARYAERSPIHRADRIAVPLALLQGEDDAIVPPEQTTLMAEALGARDVPVTLRIFPDEEHGFRKAATIAACLEAELALFAAALVARGPGASAGPRVQ
jgi:dipeptidyl aminopeptidase/acylaminoacyl peptidase